MKNQITIFFVTLGIIVGSLALLLFSARSTVDADRLRQQEEIHPTPIKVEALDDSKVNHFGYAYIITLPTGERVFTALRNGHPISHVLPPLPAEKK